MALPRASAGHQLGPYQLGERLGSGGMAEVYVAHRAGPGGFQKKLAVKRILPQLAGDSRFVAMFCDEARICAALTHPNIVQVVDFGEHDGQLFMAMEYVEGLSCARLLRAVAARGERFPIGAALFIVQQVLRGLRFAHEARDDAGRPLGIVHRDVSPGNILIGTAGEVKLTDFGIVLSAFVDRRTYPGELKGKMGYMSPEQVIGDDVDCRSDLFTLGVVLAEMLLARPLFSGKNEFEMLTRMYEVDLSVLDRYGGELPPGLIVLLTTALARDQERRFQTARDFADAVRTVARDIGVVLNDAQLLPWLYERGYLTGRSGTRQVVGPEPVPRTPMPDLSVGPVSSQQAREAQTMPPVRWEAPEPADPRYRVRLGARRELAQLTLPELLELAATGRLQPDTPVLETGRQWAQAERVPGVRRLLERPAYRFAELAGASVEWRRTLRRRTLPHVLFALASRRKSGLLIVQDGRRCKRIFLRDGAPEFIASSDRQELLGVRLVEAGLVEAEQVGAALARSVELDQRLGEVLVASGRLRPTALLRTVNDQLEARFVEVGKWTSGQLVFVPGARHGEAAVHSQFSGVQLVARAVRDGYDDAEIALLLGGLREQPLARVPASVELSELELLSSQRRALELAAAAGSLNRLVTRLARDAGVRPEDTLRGVFLGLSSGLLQMPGWP
jgi:serine/threonine protein kinase